VIRVFLADDHPVMVAGLARVLATVPDMQVVGTAHDIAGLDAQAPGSIHVLVLDVSMPGMHGAETITALRERHAPVLLFTLEPETPLVVELLRAGASGVVGKSERVEVLLDAIRTVAGGGRVMPSAMHDACGRRAGCAARRAERARAGHLPSVDPRELAEEHRVRSRAVAQHRVHVLGARAAEAGGGQPDRAGGLRASRGATGQGQLRGVELRAELAAANVFLDRKGHDYEVEQDALATSAGCCGAWC
jgi:DNA-binding NarL/FixJ family response regulator